ncbi:MAG: multiheme c-type cytochrome [Rubripirellula sp.]
MARLKSFNFKSPGFLAGLVLLVLAGGVFADYWSAEPLGIDPTFVGRSSCVDCHQAEAAAFEGSDHDLAMDHANEDTVLGDFDNATLEHDGMVSRMFRDGERFMIHTEGEEGEMEDFEVKYVFGFAPLQQYMVEFDRPDDMPPDQVARVQVLRISWDTLENRWFYLRPPDVADKLAPDDPLHWTGVAQRWQTMCADCHSTNLKRNYDPETQSYHTTFSEIDVSCEACHGPGSLHVELANKKSLFWDRHYGYGLAQLKGDDPEPQLQACAPCHSRRGVLSDGFHGGDEFCDFYSLELLEDDTYFADGQIKDEVYVYGSFIQSKMHHKGIRCTDCHDPHSLKLKSAGNETCTSCHQHSAGKYDVPSHHHHVPGTEGAMCVNCHMPHRTYMDVDKRRDHSLRIPRPDLSLDLGTPNACSGCHVEDQLKSIDEDVRPSLKEYANWMQLAAEGNEQVAEAIEKTDQWCDDACEKWYGDNRKKPPHFSEAIVAFRRGEPGAVKALLRLATQPNDIAPALARASALGELSNSGVTNATSVARKLLDDENENPIVRAAAINLFMGAPPSVVRKALMRHIDDDSRLVRTEATRVLVASGAYQALTGNERTRVDLALREVKDALMVASDRAGAHMGWAMLCEGQGKFDQAIKAYETAILIEPKMTGPRTNLASMLERLAAQTSPLQSGTLMQRVQQLRDEELPLIARDASLAPENAAVQYRYGLALYLAKDMTKAMEQLERAVELAPEVNDFRQARDLLRQKLEQEGGLPPESRETP